MATLVRKHRALFLGVAANLITGVIVAAFIEWFDSAAPWIVLGGIVALLVVVGIVVFDWRRERKEGQPPVYEGDYYDYAPDSKRFSVYITGQLRRAFPTVEALMTQVGRIHSSSFEGIPISKVGARLGRFGWMIRLALWLQCRGLDRAVKLSDNHLQAVRYLVVHQQDVPEAHRYSVGDFSQAVIAKQASEQAVGKLTQWLSVLRDVKSRNMGRGFQKAIGRLEDTEAKLLGVYQNQLAAANEVLVLRDAQND